MNLILIPLVGPGDISHRLDVDIEGTSVNKRTIQRCLNKNYLHRDRYRRILLHKICHVAARLLPICIKKTTSGNECHEVMKKDIHFQTHKYIEDVMLEKKRSVLPVKEHSVNSQAFTSRINVSVHFRDEI